MSGNMVTLNSDTEFDGATIHTIERGLAPIGMRISDLNEIQHPTTQSD